MLPSGWRDLSTEGLEDVLRSLTREREVLRGEARAVQAVLDERAADASLRRRLEGLTDAERAKLAQIIDVPGTAEGVTVGVPGAPEAESGWWERLKKVLGG